MAPRSAATIEVQGFADFLEVSAMCIDKFGEGSCLAAGAEASSMAADQRTPQVSSDGLRDLGERSVRLVRAVEAEIVPRLFLVRGGPARHMHTQQLATPLPAVDSPDVTELTRILLVHDVAIAIAYIEVISQRGMQPQRLCLDLLAPAARRLGEMWERDECSFIQVTRGLSSLHKVLREISAVWNLAADDEAVPGPTRRVLLAATPGEQHTFGIVMVGQFFRLSGWDACNEFPASTEALLNLVRDSSFSVVGLSLGGEVYLDSLTTVISAIRGASLNPAIGVMVGGPLFLRQPELAYAVGADLTASDGREAVRLADALFIKTVRPN